MNSSFDQTLVEAWREALVENAKVVELCPSDRQRGYCGRLDRESEVDGVRLCGSTAYSKVSRGFSGEVVVGGEEALNDLARDVLGIFQSLPKLIG